MPTQTWNEVNSEFHKIIQKMSNNDISLDDPESNHRLRTLVGYHPDIVNSISSYVSGCAAYKCTAFDFAHRERDIALKNLLLKLGAYSNDQLRLGIDFLRKINFIMMDRNTLPQAGMIDAYLKKGGDINFIDNSGGGYAALHEAVYKCRIDWVELLLQRGANVNVKVKGDNILSPRTPLHCAIEEADADMVCYLLTHGADPSIECKSGVKTLTFAEYVQDLSKKSIETFRESRPEYSALHVTKLEKLTTLIIPMLQQCSLKPRAALVVTADETPLRQGGFFDVRVNNDQNQKVASTEADGLRR
jgi:ankyrin repeat protein